MKEKKKKDPKKKKRALIITGSILGVFALFVITVVMITIIGDKANIKRAESYDPVVIENQLVPEKDENGYWTFTTDRDLKIMQLTDIHLGGGWLSLKKDSQAINAVATMIQAEKPDLVIITGDMAFPVFFKVLNLAALGKPFPMFVHCPHSEQDMGVWIMSRRIGVMDGKVNDHAFGNKLLLTKLPDKDSVLVGRYLSGNGKHPPPCKLGVPLLFHRFGGIP